jgi:hypothetical protein
MDRQARTDDTVLVKTREMTGRSKTLPWWLGGGGVKTTENKIHWPRCLLLTFSERGGSEGGGEGGAGAGAEEGAVGAEAEAEAEGEAEGAAGAEGGAGAKGEPGTCISFSENKDEYKTSKGHHSSVPGDGGNST